MVNLNLKSKSSGVTEHGRTVPRGHGGRPNRNHLSFNYHVCGRLMVMEWQPHWHAHHTLNQPQLAMQISQGKQRAVRWSTGGVIYMLKCSQLSACRILHPTRESGSHDRGVEGSLASEKIKWAELWAGWFCALASKWRGETEFMQRGMGRHYDGCCRGNTRRGLY